VAGPVDGDVQQRPRYVLDGARISVDGRPVAGETTATAAGPSVLVPITAFGELGVTITSPYIGQHGSDTLAAHLVVTRERRALEQAELRATLSRSPTRAVPARPRTPTPGGARGPHRRHGRNRHCPRRAHARHPGLTRRPHFSLGGAPVGRTPLPATSAASAQGPRCFSLGLRVGPYSRSPTASRAWSNS
jgi:hypothetical protein